MKLQEAREYFSTVGSLYRERAAVSHKAAQDFLAGEKEGDEYQSSLFVLKIGNDNILMRETAREAKIMLDAGTRDWEIFNNRVDALPESRGRIWANLNVKYNHITQVMGAYDKERVKAVAANDRNRIYTVAIIMLGLRLQFVEVFDGLNQFIRANNLGKDAEQGVHFLEYVNCAPVTLKCNGISLSDFAKESFGGSKKLTGERLAQYYESMMKLMQVGSGVGEYEVYASNTDSRVKEFPYYAVNSLHEAGVDADSFYSFDAQKYKNLPKSPNDIIRVAQAKTGDFLINLDKFKKQVQSTLFNSDTKGFEDIKQIVEKYLTHPDKFTMQYAIVLLGLNNLDDVKNVYRKADQLADESIEHGEFYSLLANTLRELVASRSLEALPTVEDLELTVDTEFDLAGKTIPKAGDLRSSIDETVKIFPLKDIEMRDFPIDWANTGIKTPTKFDVTIDPARPFQLSLSFQFRSREEEKLSYSIRIDTAGNTFDWTALESPRKFNDLRNRYMRIAQEALISIQRKAKELYEDRKKVENGRTQLEEVQPRAKKIRVKSEGTPKVNVEQQTKELSTSQTLFSAEDIPGKQDKEIKDIIELPTDTVKREELVAELPKDIRGTFLAKLEEGFNQEGKKLNLKRLESPGPHGERQYRLRVGNYRVVLLEHEFGDKKRKYTVRFILDRKEVYRQVGMIKQL